MRIFNDNICIVIPPKVQREIDKLKDQSTSPKKRKKAKQASAKIADYLLNDKSGKYQVKTCKDPRASEFDEDIFNKDVADNWILLSAIRLKNEEIRYKKENEKVLSKMSEDIYQLEHNLRYILMQVKLNEQNKKYDENIELIDQYIRNFGKFKAIINTNNPYFDYFMNQKINDLSNNGIDVHTSINISHSDYYLDRKYVEYLIKVINLFKKEATQITINIYEKQGFNIIEVLTSKNIRLIFDNSIKQLAQHLDAQYKITQDDNICIFKSIQHINKERRNEK